MNEQFDFRGALRAAHAVALLMATAACAAAAFRGTLFTGIFQFAGWAACAASWVWLRNDDDRQREATVEYDSEEP